jgi:hypothetical protein
MLHDKIFNPFRAAMRNASHTLSLETTLEYVMLDASCAMCMPATTQAF